MDSSRVDARADIYSLGATLYFLLTGRPLFPEGRTAQKLVWQQIKEPVPVDRLRPEVPPELAAVVHRMLKKRPDDRYATAAEVFEALEPFDRADVPPPDPALLPEPPLRVALARGPGSNPAPRTSGSTSQILVAAMRTGGSSAKIKNERGGSIDSDSEPLAVVTVAPSGERKLPARTEANSNDDTGRTPNRRSAPRASDRRTPSGPPVLLISLSVALVLALMGIVILLLRK